MEAKAEGRSEGGGKSSAVACKTNLPVVPASRIGAACVTLAPLLIQHPAYKPGKVPEKARRLGRSSRLLVPSFGSAEPLQLSNKNNEILRKKERKDKRKEGKRICTT